MFSSQFARCGRTRPAPHTLVLSDGYTFDPDNAREEASGWIGRKFSRIRVHLLRRIGELYGTVDPKALNSIKSWPAGYVSWKYREMHRGAGLKTGPSNAISASEASEAPGNDNAAHAGADAA